jgi:hypothetical protein
MTVLYYLEKNDCDGLRKVLSYKFTSWSEGIINSKQKFTNAQELFDYLCLDILTDLYYSLSRNPEIQDKVFCNLKKTMQGIEMARKEKDNL